MRYLRTSLVATLVVSSFNLVAIAQPAADSMGQWIERLAFSTPVTAYNNRSDYPTGSGELKALVGKKDFKLSFEKDIVHSGKKYNGLEFNDTVKQLGLEKSGTPTERDKRLVENVDLNIADLKEGEWLFILCGSNHAIDIYFTSKFKGQIAFVDSGWLAESRIGNADFQAYAVLAGINTRNILQDRALSGTVARYLRLGYYLSDEEAVDAVFRAPLPELKKVNVIVFAETHGVDNSTIIKMLPSADKLSKQGVKKISVLFEGFKDRELTPEELGKRGSIKQHLRPEAERALREKAPKAWDIVVTDRPNLEPNVQALLEKAAEFKRRGIKIGLRGFDVVEPN